jgi:hypothetical protein
MILVDVVKLIYVVNEVVPKHGKLEACIGRKVIFWAQVESVLGINGVFV